MGAHSAKKLTVLLLLISFSLNAQTSLHVAGYLLDAVTGEPVRRASLTLQFIGGGQSLNQPNQATQVTTADAGGHFEFPMSAVGTYRLWAERRGYPRQEYAPGVGLIVAANNPDLSFRLAPYAALTGTVVDENGDPISGAAIQLIRSEIQGGRREFRPALSTVTDDRGEYRVASLVSGRYYVSAYARAQAADENSTYARRFFPNATDLLSAAALDLEAGANQRADFRLQPEPAFHIRGHVVVTPDLTGISVTLAPRITAESFGGIGYASRFTGEGTFEISGITPGQYMLTATGYKGGLIQSASQLVTVGAADLNDVTLAPAPAPDVTGHVSGPANTAIHLRPTDSITRPVLTAKVLPDQTFTIPQAAPGDYFLDVRVPDPYYLKSATAGGLDLLRIPVTLPTAPIDITIDTNGGEVSGTVKVQDKLAPNCTVMLTQSPAQTRFTVTDINGRFLIRSLAPGEYRAYAWQDVTQIEYLNPQALQQYTGSAVTVSEGGKHTLDLKLNDTK